MSLSDQPGGRDAVHVATAPHATSETTDTVGSTTHQRIPRDGAIHISSLVVSGLIGIVLVPFMLHRLGTEQYGIWVAAVSAIAIAININFGVAETASRIVAHSLQDEQTRTFASGAAAAFVAIGFAAAVVLCAAASALVSRLQLHAVSVSIARELFLLIGASLIAEYIALYAKAVLIGTRRFVALNLLAMGSAVARAAVYAALLLSGFGLISLGASQLALAAAFALAHLIVVARLEPQLAFRPRWSQLAVLRPHLRFGLSSQLAATTQSSIWDVPPVLIALLQGSAAAVPYYVAQRLPLAALTVSCRGAAVLYPAASKFQSDKRETRSLLVTGLRWLLFLCLPACAGMFVLAPQMLQVWVGTADPQAVMILRITSIAVVLETISSAGLYVVWGRGEVQRLIVVLSAMIAVLAAAVCVLGWTFGLAGAAWAIVIATAIGASAFLSASARAGGATAREILREALRPTLLPWLLSIAVFVAGARFVSASLPAVVGITLVAAAVYLGSAFLFSRRQFLAAWRFGEVSARPIAEAAAAERQGIAGEL